MTSYRHHGKGQSLRKSDAPIWKVKIGSSQGLPAADKGAIREQSKRDTEAPRILSLTFLRRFHREPLD